ncbi:hypothetical protein IFM89_037153 [Coptis chinensis]|uniref:non-specific serine/threonine protein kinase n=1 Tax=Coptis chinensis TaxID=261450 RepID=A0A835LXI6_9MAGN|nr:hypothetical protein IFM89_037153 [Coptis chinensis]
MGNCWGEPVENQSTCSTTTRPPSPGNLDFLQEKTDWLSKNNSDNIEVEVPNNSKSPKNRQQHSTSLEEECPDGQILDAPKLRVYTFAELKNATRNFRPDTILGEGGFGRVFKGWVDEKTFAPAKVGTGMMVAVKKANSENMLGLEQWQSEVDFLGRLSHPNLVKLIGYCWEEKEFLLVYEFMQKGSLENHLFRRGGSSVQPLPWSIRLKIAIGAARGLAFLHASQKQIIYRDFKASNILLDGEFDAKISDFGLAKNGPATGDSHVTTRVMGTYGYAAPESFIRQERCIWVRRGPTRDANRKLMPIMDTGLKDQFPVKGAVHAAQLTLRCLGPDPRSRPSMKEVLETLEQIKAIEDKPKETRRSSMRPTKNGEGQHNNVHQRSPLHSKHGTGTGAH